MLKDALATNLLWSSSGSFFNFTSESKFKKFLVLKRYSLHNVAEEGLVAGSSVFNVKTFA